MADNLSFEQRKYCMSQIREKDTKPEIIIRKIVHALGYRFRLHRRDLPGCPDLVFPSRRKIIFVHGCFWHRHSGCSKSTTPTTRNDYWIKKFKGNVKRDRTNIKSLRNQGWDVLVIWECETKETEKLYENIKYFLEKKDCS
ncbi:MAG: DNA mismatch endonuclease Vsr [Candidatus Omnitrophota bacterium]|nr:MAG: DNA mismatch endonuclease Vsr [Candidatus Omnitrophota bacterium]